MPSTLKSATEQLGNTACLDGAAGTSAMAESAAVFLSSPGLAGLASLAGFASAGGVVADGTGLAGTAVGAAGLAAVAVGVAGLAAATGAFAAVGAAGLAAVLGAATAAAGASGLLAATGAAAVCPCAGATAQSNKTEVSKAFSSSVTGHPLSIENQLGLSAPPVDWYRTVMLIRRLRGSAGSFAL